MVEYKRFISYLYDYENGMKNRGAGYVRCEVRQNQCRIAIRLQEGTNVSAMSYQVYLYQINSLGVPIGYPMAVLAREKIIEELRKQTEAQNVCGTGKALQEFDGILLIGDNGNVIGTQWSDVPIQVRLFRTKEEDAKGEESPAEEEMGVIQQSTTIEENKIVALVEDRVRIEDAPTEGQAETQIEDTIENVTEDEEEVSDNERNSMAEAELKVAQQFAREEQIRNGKASMVDELIQSKPKLPAFDNYELFDCVRIEPNDIGYLDMDNWKLGVNSFLTHGYYNYRYLMLGKIRFQDGEAKSVLGVPGVFNNKEKYIANIFGFQQFVPVKHTNTRTRNFGYWIVDVKDPVK